METHVFLAVLFAALMHASWNAMIRFGADRGAVVLLLALVQAAIALPLLPFVPVPDPASWGWLAAAALLHVGYKLFLVQAYAHADLSQVYPLARGTAPMIVALVSAAFLGEVLTAGQMAAVAAISCGILVMALRGGTGGGIGGRALFYTLGTAGFTAGYTLVDGIGARIAGTAAGFILWLVVWDAVGMAIHAGLTRGRAVIPAMRPIWRTGFAAGAMSLASYWVAVWAFTRAPIALVASLRESSILFAVLIAAFVLRERVSGWRWASAAAIGTGVVLMRL